MHPDLSVLVCEATCHVVLRQSAKTFAILSGLRPLMELSDLSHPQQNVVEV